MDIDKRSSDPRIRVVGLVLLTWAHATASNIAILLLTMITLVIIAWYRDAFWHSLPVILITTIFLCSMALLAWFTTASISLRDLLLGVVKWLSMSTVSLTIFSSLNAMELIVALIWLRVPLSISLALGVSLRFFPILAEQGSKLLMIYRLRSSNRSMGRGYFKQLRCIILGLIPAMFISVLRQVENISLSVLTQDIERRVLEYRPTPLGIQDFSMILIINIIPSLIVFFS